MRSTNRLPSELCVPYQLLRQITAGRSARSARLLVGSSPSLRLNVHKASQCVSRSWLVACNLSQRLRAPICTNADYQASLAEIERLFDAQPDTPEGDRLDVLTTLDLIGNKGAGGAKPLRTSPVGAWWRSRHHAPTERRFLGACGPQAPTIFISDKVY